MAKVKTEKAAPQAKLSKVIHAEYAIRSATKKEASALDGPDPIRTGAAAVLVGDASEAAAVLQKVVGLKKGETLEIRSVRVLVENVNV